MPNKTIHLCERTALIAGRMGNFSEWVRHQLIQHARSATQTENEAYQTMQKHLAPEGARVWGDMKDKCNPRHRKGLCAICYPDGE